MKWRIEWKKKKIPLRGGIRNTGNLTATQPIINHAFTVIAVPPRRVSRSGWRTLLCARDISNGRDGEKIFEHKDLAKMRTLKKTNYITTREWNCSVQYEIRKKDQVNVQGEIWKEFSFLSDRRARRLCVGRSILCIPFFFCFVLF